MKYSVLFLTLFFIVNNSSALGDKSVLPNDPAAMTDTVSTLNQVTDETDGNSTLGQQDMQEKQFQEDRKREQKEWEEQKQIDNSRFDIPQD